MQRSRKRIARPETLQDVCTKKGLMVSPINPSDKTGAGSAHKPSSVSLSGCPQSGDDHSSGTAVARRLKRHNPRTSGGQPSSVLLFGLAPDGVCQAPPVTRGTGELLPRHFTLTAGWSRGGIFSVALSLGSPPVAVSDHPALWSSDFPPIPYGTGDHLFRSGTRFKSTGIPPPEYPSMASLANVSARVFPSLATC